MYWIFNIDMNLLGVSGMVRNLKLKKRAMGK